jgi:CheY-like chemotaxis protein
MGYATFLANGPTQNSAWREDVEEISKAAERAASLTHQLLAFSRRQALQPKVIDLNAEIVDVEKMLQRIMGEDVQWSTHLSPNLWNIKADPGQIQQILMNLAVNARDAMPEGGKFTVRTENLELITPPPGIDFSIPLGSYVVLFATDTGIGMDGATQARIFEPFFSTKEKGRGTGLGLAMVYGVVKQSGGYITAVSSPGQGATFKLYLPRVHEALDAKATDKVPSHSLRGSEIILVVDDDESVRNLVRRILSENGYTIWVSGKGEEAIDLSRKQGAPQLLLTDIVLPDFNGMELAKKMTALFPQLKVLYISGYLDRNFGHFVLDAKVPFLQKPFTAVSLTRRVREVLDASTQQE